MVNDFHNKLLPELKKIEEAWPGLNYGLAQGVLMVEPSVPSVPSLHPSMADFGPSLGQRRRAATRSQSRVGDASGSAGSDNSDFWK